LTQEAENVVERVFAATEGRGADAVILAVGGNALIQDGDGCGAARRQGDAVCPDPAWRGYRSILAAVCVDEKTLLGSYSSSFPILDEVTGIWCWASYRKGFDLTQLISHRFQMEAGG
jgi:L-iditol 2-dehydrogenase